MADHQDPHSAIGGEPGQGLHHLADRHGLMPVHPGRGESREGVDDHQTDAVHPDSLPQHPQQLSLRSFPHRKRLQGVRLRMTPVEDHDLSQVGPAGLQPGNDRSGRVVLKGKDCRRDLPDPPPVKRGQAPRQLRCQSNAQEALAAAGRPGHQGHGSGGQVGFPDPLDPIGLDLTGRYENLSGNPSEPAALLLIDRFGLNEIPPGFLPSPTVLRDGVGHVPAVGPVLFRNDYPDLRGPDPVQLAGQPGHRLPPRTVGVRPQDHFPPRQAFPVRAPDGAASAQPAQHPIPLRQSGQGIGALLPFNDCHRN